MKNWGIGWLIVGVCLVWGQRSLVAQSDDLVDEIEIVNLVFTNSPYAFFKGLELPSEPAEAWLEPGFDDSAWFQNLFTPFSYGESLEIGTVLEDMQGNYTTFMLRRPFQVESPELITDLVVHAAVDDGFIAWVNGHEILRVNVPEQPFGVHYTAHTASEPVPTLRYEIPIDDDVLLFGENVLAIQVVNGSLNSSDILFELSLDGLLGEDRSLPPLEAVDPSAEPSFEGVFGFRQVWRFFRGLSEASEPVPAWRSPDFDDSDWEEGASPLFYGEDIQGGTTLDGMAGNYSTIYLRRSFEVEENQLNRGVRVNALIDDGLIVWINGVELGRSSADPGDLPFDSVARFGAVEPLAPVTFTGGSDLLRLGTNWVAVQALNASLFSSDFFFDLELGVLETSIIPENSNWRYFSGSSDPNGESAVPWFDPSFDDRSWSLDEAPFVNVRQATGRTVIPGMVGNFGSVFLRKRFFLDHVDAVEALDAELFARHGAVVWLNGTEVERFNVPLGELGLDTGSLRALGESGIDGDEAASDTFNIAPELLRSGENVIAVQAVNFEPSREDFRFDLRLSTEGVDVSVPSITALTPARGDVASLSEVTLEFSEPVRGIQAADLTVNGKSARDVLRDDRTFTFLLDEPEVWPAHVVFAPTGPILDLAPNANFFPFPRTEWTYNRVDSDAPELLQTWPAPGVQVSGLGVIELAFGEPVVGVVEERFVANGQSAESVVELEPGRYQVRFASEFDEDVLFQIVEPEGILDLSGNPYSGASQWGYSVQPTTLSRVVISELVSANATGLQDEDGDFEDWIEIFNEGETAVDLEGWSLSDKEDDPRKWAFPAVVLEPNARLIVFASGKDRRQPDGANLHTNFKLARSGETVLLVRPDLPVKIASQSPDPLPELRDGVSLGINAQGAWRFLSSPTPGLENSGTEATEILSKVSFNARRGLYEVPFQLNLSSDDVGVSIRYTLDGSEPSEDNGLLYSGPIPIGETRIVRAAAFREGALASDVRTESYLFESGLPLGDLPIFSLSTANSNIVGPTGILGIGGGEYVPRGSEFVWSAVNEGDYHNPTQRGRAWERPVSVEFFEPAGESFQTDGGIRVHGSVFARPKLREDSKFGFRLYFRSAYDGEALTYPVIPESDDRVMDRIVLRSGHNDSKNPFISDELARRLSASMGRLTSRGSFASVFLNGEYQGYYNHTERINISSLREWFGGGEEWDIVKPFAFLSEGDLIEWNEMISFFLSSDLSLPGNFLEAKRHLDLEAFADYILANIYSDTGDWVRSNWRAVRENVPGARFKFLVWDAEFSYGIYGRPVDRNTLELPGELGVPTFITQIFDQLKRNEEFRLLFADQVHRHFFNDGALTNARIQETYERTRDEVLSVIPDFLTHIEDTWIPGRRTFMLEDLEQAGLMVSRNAPIMSRQGGTVFAGFGLTMESAEGGTIYYTLDGSDPRTVIRGTPSVNANPYLGQAVVLTESVIVKARTLNGNQWSALNEAEFRVGASDSGLSITEIHYHPEDESPEYFEFTNRGGAPVDLSGASFSGINFEFESGTQMMPGDLWVLVREEDASLFASLHPEVFVVGEYGGKLSNGGEQIKLASSAGAFLMAVNYDDSNGWPEAADGDGPSLELRRLDADPNDAAQWRASAEPGGSPGSFVAEPVSTLRLSEVYVPRSVLGEPTFVELMNEGASPIDLSGWTIESAKSEDASFEFEETFNLGVGQRIVVYFDTTDSSLGDFISEEQFDEQEDTVIVRRPSGEIVDSVRFGDHVSQASFVREASGAWTLGVPSPGLENVRLDMASSTQLVVNEWQANPLPGDDDWFEIYNPDPSRPAALQGLTFSDGQSFATLRSLVFVPAGGFVRLWADNGRGPDHLPFRLSAAGGSIAIFGMDGERIDEVRYSAQSEGTTNGRRPDGSTRISSFADGGSPGASNQEAVLGELALSEVLWINQAGSMGPHGAFSSYVEVVNLSSTEQALDSLLLRVESEGEDSYAFPQGSRLSPGERRVVWIDRRDFPALDSLFLFQTDTLLAPAGGSVQLLNRDLLVLDSVEFGNQLPDLPLGRDDLGWALRVAPTPGNVESMRLDLGSGGNLKINEWAAANPEGDWVELFNPTDRVIDLGGMILTDKPGLVGKLDAVIGPHTFVASGGWVHLGDDRDFPVGAPFTLDFSLAREGEFIRLYDTLGELVDAIDFSLQVRGRTEGRIPDGGEMVVSSLVSSPGESNVGRESRDSDQDGIPDDWELENGLDPFDPLDALADPDLDGVDNFTEFVLGTNPFDEIEIIVGSISLGDGSVELLFEVRPDTHYALEFKSSLEDESWETLLEFETDDEQESVEFSDEAVQADEQRFYRLIRL